METLTSTKNNVKLVQQAFDDFLKGKIPAVVDACADDMEWSSYENPDVPYAITYHGKSGAAEFFKTLSETVNYLRFEPQQFISEGDDVVVLGHHTATVSQPGKLLTMISALFLKFVTES